MPGWRSSPRLRRRSWWIAGVLAAAGGLAALALGMQNTPQFPKQHIGTAPARIVPEPRPARLSKAEVYDVLETSARFIGTAVARKHLTDAYDLVGPELRGGMTRAEWAKGDNPVVPFPAASIGAWTIAYSYRNDVALDLGLIAKSRSDTVAKAFRIELRRSAGSKRWRVVLWNPIGVSGAGNVLSLAKKARAAPPQPQTATLGAWWLVFPVALLSLALVLPLAIWIRSWRAGRKAEHAYRAERGLT